MNSDVHVNKLLNPSPPSVNNCEHFVDSPHVTFTYFLDAPLLSLTPTHIGGKMGFSKTVRSRIVGLVGLNFFIFAKAELNIAAGTFMVLISPCSFFSVHG